MKWTSVNEKLPDYNEDALIWCPSGMAVAQLWKICKCGQEDHFTDGIWCKDLDVVSHWMNLPKRPPSNEPKLVRSELTRKQINRAFNKSIKKK